MNMKLEKMYIEEDLFPREITSYETRYYGLLFYNEDNKDSYDSNHAIIYKERICNGTFILKADCTAKIRTAFNKRTIYNRPSTINIIDCSPA